MDILIVFWILPTILCYIFIKLAIKYDKKRGYNYDKKLFKKELLMGLTPILNLYFLPNFIMRFSDKKKYYNKEKNKFIEYDYLKLVDKISNKELIEILNSIIVMANLSNWNIKIFLGRKEIFGQYTRALKLDLEKNKIKYKIIFHLKEDYSIYVIRMVKNDFSFELLTEDLKDLLTILELKI